MTLPNLWHTIKGITKTHKTKTHKAKTHKDIP